MNSMPVHPVHYYTTETVENEFFSFVCRYCERQLWGDYATRNLAAGRYENLCLTCAEEIRATYHEALAH